MARIDEELIDPSKHHISAATCRAADIIAELNELLENMSASLRVLVLDDLNYCDGCGEYSQLLAECTCLDRM